MPGLATRTPTIGATQKVTVRSAVVATVGVVCLAPTVTVLNGRGWPGGLFAAAMIVLVVVILNLMARPRPHSE